MSDGYEYFKNKNPNRTYIGKSIPAVVVKMNEAGTVEEVIRPLRYISKVIDTSEQHIHIKKSKEATIRVTAGERQEIIAHFWEDSREIKTLKFQKYTIKNGSPMRFHSVLQATKLD